LNRKASLTRQKKRETIHYLLLGAKMGTSKKDASKAGKLLAKPNTPASVKSVAASDLAQAKKHSGGKKK
jgi:hypothetical protein